VRVRVKLNLRFAARPLNQVPASLSREPEWIAPCLLELIEKTFAEKYDLIFKDGYRSSLIYTKAPVDDITAVVRQELLKANPRN
jgi:hypothetical protein